MLNYIISAINDNERVYYAGKHYESSGMFSNELRHATLYTKKDEAQRMVDVLSERFPSIKPFTITLVKVTIQEVTQK